MNTEIRIAKEQDIPALCDIWKSCFLDSEEYINYFYDENFERIESYILTVDKKPVSMVNMLPASFKNNNDFQPAKFIYAAGTLPAYRGKGYMGKIIRFTKSEAKKHEYALFLKPSSASLTEFYQSFGFKINSYFQLVSLLPSEKQTLLVSDISCTEYNSLRNAAFCDTPYVKWSDEHIHWCIEENEYFSGKTLKFEFEDKDYFLLGYPEENTLIINETNLSLNQLKHLSGALCNVFGTEHIKAYMPDASCCEGERIISSVVYNTSICNTYVNLILI